MNRITKVQLPSQLAVLLAGFALLLAGAPDLSAQERESPPSRSLPSASRAPSPAPSVRPPTSSPSAPSASSPGSPSRSGGRGYSRGYGRGYGHGYGYGYGYARYYGYGHYWPFHHFYSGYHRPYYPWGMVWYPAYTSDTRVGALDLAVKPKKAAVYVDGRYVGTAGKFDGYPGYLVLSEGSHQLVFHLEGRETVARRVRVRVGPVMDLAVELRDGVTTDPEELFEPIEPERTADTDRDRTRSRGLLGKIESEERRAALDLRGEPGRFRLDVAPLDASVYLDGRFLGSGEELARLHSGMMVDAGEHVLDVQRPGYEAERIEFEVEAGDEAEIKVALDRFDAPSD